MNNSNKPSTLAGVPVVSSQRNIQYIPSKDTRNVTKNTIKQLENALSHPVGEINMPNTGDSNNSIQAIIPEPQFLLPETLVYFHNRVEFIRFKSQKEIDILTTQISILK
jgi:hypothetical protein